MTGEPGGKPKIRYSSSDRTPPCSSRRQLPTFATACALFRSAEVSASRRSSRLRSEMSRVTVLMPRT